MNPAPTIDAMRNAAQALKLGDPCATVRAIQIAQVALDAAKAEALAEIEATRSYEDDGASTLNTWVRNELRMTSADAASLMRASSTFAALPLPPRARSAPTTCGRSPMGSSTWVWRSWASSRKRSWCWPSTWTRPSCWPRCASCATRCFPTTSTRRMSRGWTKKTFRSPGWLTAAPPRLRPLCGGSIVTGFLNAATGLKFKKVLDSVSAPRDKDDDRPGAERRVQGLDDLLSGYLNHGMPSDKGVRPHAAVIVDADTLEAAAERVKATTQHPHQVPDPMPPTKPATLVGYGPIGPNLLMYFMCISDFTAFLMRQNSGDRQAQILNVGRDHRLATLKQRRAVLVRQQGQCATPGCHHTHLEIHHVIFWSDGGTTDLDLMVGLCVRCHHLLHRGLLHITGTATDGFTFTNRHGVPLRRRRRTSYTPAA